MKIVYKFYYLVNEVDISLVLYKTCSWSECFARLSLIFFGVMGFVFIDGIYRVD